MEFSFSSRGLSQINLNEFDDDFTFRFHNTKFQCPSFIAEFISKKVALEKQRDSSFKEIYIGMKINNPMTIPKLRMLIAGQKFDLNNSENSELQRLLVLIRNEDVFSLDSELTVNNVVSSLTFKESNNGDMGAEIDFIAEHFEEMKEKIIPNRYLYMILDSKKLRIKTEKSLLDYITDLIKKDASNLNLVRFIRCEYLNKGEEIEQYVSLIDQLGDAKIIGSLWSSLRNYFLVSNPGSQQRFKRLALNINYATKKGKFNGIIQKLTNVCEGNVIEKEAVSVTSSSLFNPSKYPLINVVQEDGDWASGSNGDGWLKFDFKENRVLINSYSLRSNSKYWSAQPKSWKVEGSNDDQTWETLDEQTDNELLHGPLREEVFKCKETQEYKYIRISGTGKNWYGSMCLPINRVEFFGRLVLNN